MIKKINSKKTLAVANQTKRIETYARAKAALQAMEQNNLPINFESVAKMAGISKAWLYKQGKLYSRVIK